MDAAAPSAETEASVPLPQEQGDAVTVSTSTSAGGKPKRRRKCRFFGTSKGCRAGDACPFAHVVDGPQERKDQLAKTEPVPVDSNAERGISNQAAAPSDQGEDKSGKDALPSQKPTALPARPAVQRPIPKQQLQNPRDFQISQVKKRFSPKQEKTEKDGDVLIFGMHPSDPDFPFDIDALNCNLSVPSDFPNAKPTLRVTNKEMERGYQLNVERGFDAIWNQMTQPSLLKAMNAVDKRLEELLTAKKADTIKIVTNAKNTAIDANQPVVASTSSRTVSGHVTSISSPQIPEPCSAARIAQAKARRDTEVQVLKRRLGRHSLFVKGGDDNMFTLPIEPRKHKDLPPDLQAVKSVRLFVPASYDLEPCAIELLGVSGSAVELVEKSFQDRARKHPEVPLLAQVNYLAQNMQQMVTRNAEAAPDVPAMPSVSDEIAAKTATIPQHGFENDRSHIVVIPRPSEWSNPAGENDGSSDSSYTSSDEEYDSDSADDKESSPQPAVPLDTREKGVMISFPSLELYGIELLELATISLTIKCERCKESVDVSNVRNNEKGDHTGIRSETCKKCSSQLGIGYRKDLMHANSVRAGYLDLEGCTVADLLPSSFLPTCAACSTPYTGAGVVSVRGESSMALCRECHHKMTFRIPDVKFLHVGTAAAGAALRGGLPRKKPKEQLGIVAGQPLPRRGRCTHYAKSYRWFRFSCCAKVYPCDRCHDADTDHPNEHANRMICGLCSREQNYRPEDCGVCHSPLTGKTGSGFWEGGKGTRDKLRMSRKDPRKFKRRGGGALAKAAKAKA